MSWFQSSHCFPAKASEKIEQHHPALDRLEPKISANCEQLKVITNFIGITSFESVCFGVLSGNTKNS
jgi:hypothetical protein